MQQQSRQSSARSGINNNEVYLSNSESAVYAATGSGQAQPQHLKTSEAVTIYPSRPPPQVQGHQQGSGHQGQAKRQQRLQRQKEIDIFYRRSTSESLPEDHVEVVTSSVQPQNHDLKIRYAK